MSMSCWPLTSSSVCQTPVRGPRAPARRGTTSASSPSGSMAGVLPPTPLGGLGRGDVVVAAVELLLCPRSPPNPLSEGGTTWKMTGPGLRSPARQPPPSMGRPRRGRKSARRHLRGAARAAAPPPAGRTGRIQLAESESFLGFCQCGGGSAALAAPSWPCPKFGFPRCVAARQQERRRRRAATTTGKITETLVIMPVGGSAPPTARVQHAPTPDGPSLAPSLAGLSPGLLGGHAGAPWAKTATRDRVGRRRRSRLASAARHHSLSPRERCLRRPRRSGARTA